MYVTDSLRGNVLKFTPKGNFIVLAPFSGSKGEKPLQFAYPFGICIDSNDIMYVTDGDKCQVMVFTIEGEFLGCVDNIRSPYGVAVDKTACVQKEKYWCLDLTINLYVAVHAYKFYIS